MIRLGLLLLIYSLRFYTSAQESVPNKLKNLKPDRQLTNFIKLDTVKQAKPNDNYQLILSRGKWHAIGNGDGQVFTPENGVWKRIDSTRLEGYHYGAFLFDCNGTLMKYGGYGFWKNHGMFVYFHEGLGDWRIIPCNRDLPSHGNLAFFSRKQNTLYSFGNFIFNQSTSEEKIFLDSLYCIDLLNMKWQNLGKLNYKLIEKFHLHHRLNTLSHEQGCFVLPISTDSTALYFNFENLEYTAYNSKSNPRLYHFLCDMPSHLQVYSDSYGLKILDENTLLNIDSISWETARAQPLESADIIDKKTTTVIFEYSLLFGALGLLLGLSLIFFIYKRKKVPLKADDLPLSPPISNSLDLSILNTIIFKGAMYPIDPGDYIVIQKLAQQDATTIDLNDWLGLENKQPENQKKQRAEWIKRMNVFFNQIGFKEDAFNRERQETDKRMFVYKMNDKIK
jgi:hypothetical protein